MSLNFSANQYNKAFDPYNLQNWEIPREHKERPCQHDGFTQFIANEKGHLMEGVKRSRESPWGNFVGTWDLPIKIPGNRLANSTARRPAAAENLRQMKDEGDEVIKGQTKHVGVPDPLPIKEDMTADAAVTSGSPAPRVVHSPVEVRPASNAGSPHCQAHTPVNTSLPNADFIDAQKSESPINWPASSPAK